jgi:hypothetical protein
MKRLELSCAIRKETNNQNAGRRPNLEEISRRWRNWKRSKLRRMVSANILENLIIAGLCIFLAPPPAGASDDHLVRPPQEYNDKDTPRGGEDDDRRIRAEIAFLLEKIESLQSAVFGLDGQLRALLTANASLMNEFKSLQASNAKLQSQVSSLQTNNTTLETRLAAVQSNPALALGPFVTVDPNPEVGVIGPNITFSRANIHIVSGSQATDDHGNSTGLGNLIIGYDEDPNTALPADSAFFGIPIMFLPGIPTPLLPGDRGGSHNLVIGAGNRFTKGASGGLVVGERNSIQNLGASVTGGFVNSSSGLLSSVSAGVGNGAGGQFAGVSGGGENSAGNSGDTVSGGWNGSAVGGYSSVSGGYSNLANNNFAHVSGGAQNSATANSASVSGGQLNTANGFASIVLGGQNVTTNTDHSIAP